METAELAGLDFGTMSNIDVRGTQIELFTAGSGEPLLFLHGIDGIDGSASVLRELSRSFQVFAPSHPGFGASELPEGMNRVDDLGYFYLDMLDHLELGAPTIVGASFGGWVACEMLTKDPSRASSLILASPLGLKTAERREQWVADIFMLSKQELATRLQASAPQGPSVFEMEYVQLRRALRNDEALSVFGWSPYMCNPKLADRLHRITCPTLVVWGAEDAFVQPTYQVHWKEALPQARVVSLADAGHRSHADKPNELAALVKQFVAGARA